MLRPSSSATEYSGSSTPGFPIQPAASPCPARPALKAPAGQWTAHARAAVAVRQPPSRRSWRPAQSRCVGGRYEGAVTEVGPQRVARRPHRLHCDEQAAEDLAVPSLSDMTSPLQSRALASSRCPRPTTCRWGTSRRSPPSATPPSTLSPARGASRDSRLANASSPRWSHRAWTTRRSPHGWAWRTKRCATHSQRFTRSSRSTAAPVRSPCPGTWASNGRRLRTPVR
jgi:hypothetical protein